MSSLSEVHVVVKFCLRIIAIILEMHSVECGMCPVAEFIMIDTLNLVYWFLLLRVVTSVPLLAKIDQEMQL